MKRQRQRMSPERALRILRADAHRLGLARARVWIENLTVSIEGSRICALEPQVEVLHRSSRDDELINRAQQRIGRLRLLPLEVLKVLEGITGEANQEEYDRLVRIDQTPQCCRSTMCAQPSHRPNPNPNRAARRLNPNEAFPGPTLRYLISTGGWICPWTNKRPNDDELYGMIQMGWQVP